MNSVVRRDRLPETACRASRSGSHADGAAAHRPRNQCGRHAARVRDRKSCCAHAPVANGERCGSVSTDRGALITSDADGEQ